MSDHETDESPEGAPDVMHRSRLSLARALGADEKSLRNWEKLPGAPTTRSESEWREFIARHGLHKGETKTLAELKVLIAQEELALKRHKNALAAKKLTPTDEVRHYLAVLGAKFDLLLTQKIETELPARVVGKDIVAVRAECKALHDEIRESCNAGISQWVPAEN